ncbi:MAG: hypothetical protein V1746_04440 [bacterium]
MFFSRRQWFLLIHQGKQPVGDWRQFQKLTPPKDRFWADPFVIYHNGAHYVFIEEYIYSHKKGHIACFLVGEDGQAGEPVKILERPYHLSYPFLFEWEGSVYLLPETASNKTIEVYRCVRFPFEWELCSTLMKDIVAVDTTLFFHNNKWWLFTNVKEHARASTWDKLFLYHADHPLSAHWQPHPQNPVVADAGRARPAGKIFEHNGEIYRPAQDCSRRYGAAVVFNKITKLDEKEYREETAQSLPLGLQGRIAGSHTFNYTHGLTVLDGR